MASLERLIFGVLFLSMIASTHQQLFRINLFPPLPIFRPPQLQPKPQTQTKFGQKPTKSTVQPAPAPQPTPQPPRFECPLLTCIRTLFERHDNKPAPQQYPQQHQPQPIPQALPQPSPSSFEIHGSQNPSSEAGVQALVPILVTQPGQPTIALPPRVPRATNQSKAFSDFETNVRSLLDQLDSLNSYEGNITRFTLIEAVSKVYAMLLVYNESRGQPLIRGNLKNDVEILIVAVVNLRDFFDKNDNPKTVIVSGSMNTVEREYDGDSNTDFVVINGQNNTAKGDETFISGKNVTTNGEKNVVLGENLNYTGDQSFIVTNNKIVSGSSKIILGNFYLDIDRLEKGLSFVQYVNEKCDPNTTPYF